MGRGLLHLLLGSCALVIAGAQAHAQSDTASGAEPRVVLPAPDADAASALNPTERTVTLTVPVRRAGAYVGDIVIEIDPQDRVSFSAERLIALLEHVLERKGLDALGSRLAAAGQLAPPDFQQAGVALAYNPQELALDLDIASERLASRSLQITSLDQSRVGSFVEPANFSAYLNVRSNLDYFYGGDSLEAPTTLLDGAARFKGVVLESEGVWQPAGNGFQRLGSRAIYDDQERLMRWTAGDLQPVGRGFQAIPDMAGLSVFRSYGVLQPQRVARPRGDRTFYLDRPATVEVQVNGQLLRQLQLQPGNYDLRDFPFTQGANDIRLSIRDDSGRTEVLRFNVFLDQSQLGSGLSEFGFYAGLLSFPGPGGPDYSENFAASGFYRRGISDALTVGANFQASTDAQLGGFEGIWSTRLGTFGGSLGLSHLADHGLGHAALITFQRLIYRPGGQVDSLNLFAESRSAKFGSLGTINPSHPFAWEAGGGYTRSFTNSLYGGIDGRYSKGRDAQRDIYSARGTLGWRVTDTLSVTGDAAWEQDTIGRRLSARVTATMRLGRYSTARGEFDTRYERGRLSYATLRGQGVGAYNIAADLERSEFGSGANVTANYFANRAELGFSHFGAFEDTFGSSTGQRTSLRLATSLAFADGALSVGRPIYDSFAIVRGHRSLDGAPVVVEPTPFGFTATTGKLGAATHPSLGAYAERTVTIDAPTAPATADLGQGSFRLFPPYRSGYKLEVGSAYNVSAIGRLLDSDGEPVALVSGTATETGATDREPVPVFTNREGRFGALGLTPGRWRIDMQDERKSSFILDIPQDTEGVIQVGELKPAEDRE